MAASISQINRALFGFTDVLELHLSRDLSTGSYQLRILLENAAAEVVVLGCQHVSNLSISEFGGGLTQFLALRAEDMSNIGLDRVSMHFADLERHSIGFNCASAQVTMND